ncbi:MAG: tRNA uridine-5-carboxymethylaminomethyl(34) synthesis enzyme MnmG, partial [Thermomicrobiales bacterium]
DPAARSLNALELVRRPGATLPQVFVALDDLDLWPGALPTSPVVLERAEIAAKYSAFIAKEEKEVERFRAHDAHPIPPSLGFDAVTGLRVEAAQALTRTRPATIGQAARTAGVAPSDIGALLIHLKRLGAATAAS